MKKSVLSSRLFCTAAITAAVLAVYALILIFSGSRFVITVNYDPSLPCEKAEVFFGENGSLSESDLLETTDISIKDGYVKAKLKAHGKGGETVHLKAFCVNKEGKSSAFISIAEIKAVGNGLILNNVDRLLFPFLSVLCFLLLAYYLFCFAEAVKTRRFSYDTVFFLSVSLLLALMLFIWSGATLYSFVRYHTTSSDAVYSLNRNFMTAITAVTFPLMLLFTLSVSVSNVVLMKREGFRPTNALGIITSVFMFGGLAVIGLLYYVLKDRPSTVLSVIYSVLSSLYVFFETVLAAAILYGVYVSRHTPEPDKDYIIILGCRIKEDGTLYPLIRGRADQAIEFYYRQLNETGKAACFIPSGGQGSDENISEGEAIRNYLISQGIPEDRVIAETRSTTTKENMRFSKEIIDRRQQNAQVIFSTTSYHVLRSGEIAYENGIDIDGIGSPTKWYFWPNAFLREVAGMFVNQPKKQILITVLIALAAGVGSYLYSLL